MRFVFGTCVRIYVTACTGVKQVNYINRNLIFNIEDLYWLQKQGANLRSMLLNWIR